MNGKGEARAKLTRWERWALLELSLSPGTSTFTIADIRAKAVQMRRHWWIGLCYYLKYLFSW